METKYVPLEKFLALLDRASTIDMYYDYAARAYWVATNHETDYDEEGDLYIWRSWEDQAENEVTFTPEELTRIEEIEPGHFAIPCSSDKDTDRYVVVCYCNQPMTLADLED